MSASSVRSGLCELICTRSLTCTGALDLIINIQHILQVGYENESFDSMHSLTVENAEY